MFFSSATVNSTINEADEEILKCVQCHKERSTGVMSDESRFLLDVRSVPLERERNGFHLVFTFESNPFFTPTELKKTYILGEEDDSLLVSQKGCTIDWKPNRSPKFKNVWKRGKQTRVEVESFFDFFDPPQVTLAPSSPFRICHAAAYE